MNRAVYDDAPRRLDLSDIGAREFEVVEPGACYRLKAPGCDVLFEVDRLAWRSHELSAELLVRTKLRGTEAIDGVLSVARINLSNARARLDRAQQLARQSRAADIPWGPLIEELCQRVLAAERTGEPALVLRDVVPQADEHREVRVGGFRLPVRHPAILFGDGGSAKSYLALHLAGLLAREGWRVALFDWELDEYEHRDRLERLFPGDLPDRVLYSRCTRPLVYEVDRLKRIVHEQGVDYGVFDSVAFACHDAVESSDAALAYFRAVRYLGIGSLHLAHVSKDTEHGDKKPFGSSFFFNSARAIWNIKATDDEAGTLTLGVFDRKPSLRARQHPFALEVAFKPTETTIRHVEIADSPDFAPKISLFQRLRVRLRAGAMTRAEIAMEFEDIKPETITRTIRRAVERGHLVQFPSADGTERIGLASRSA